MTAEAYANDYETTLNAPGGTGSARPVNLTFRTAIPSALSGGNFRIRVQDEYLLIPAGGVSGLVCTGCTTVEGSVAANHPDNATVDQCLTLQGLKNFPGKMTTQGDMVTLDSTLNPVRIPLGAPTTVMTSDAATGLPVWAAASGGGGTSTPLLNPYTARMFRNAAYNSVAATWTKIPFDTVDYDDASMVTIGSSRFVAPVAGKYLVTAGWRDTTANSTNFAIAVYVNGAQRDLGPLFGYAAALGGASVAGIVKLAATDYVELFYFVQNVIAFDVGSVNTWAEIALIPGTPALPASTLVARMYRNAALTLAAAAFTKFPFDTVDYDPNGNLTIGSNQYTAPIAGKYLLSASIYSQVPDRIALQVKVNGNVVRKDDKSATYSAEIVTQLNLVAGDVVTLEYFAANADAVQLGTPTSSNNFLEIAFIAGTGASIWVPQGPVIIPGFAGSPDIKAGGANDDEFEQNAAGTPAGWTAFNSPTVVDTNTTKSHLHMTHASEGSAYNWRGILKAAPAIPYTVTAKLAAILPNDHVGNVEAGLLILDGTSTGKTLAVFGHVATPDTGIAVDYLTAWATFSSEPAFLKTQVALPSYFKVVVHAANNIDVYGSHDGLLWTLMTAGFASMVNASHVGLGVLGYSAAVEALFDWIRFS